MAVGSQRNHTIDYLRAAAVLVVLITHFVGGVVGDPPAPLNGAGWAVMSFFTISGFLITSNILRRYGAIEKISLQQFYTMRFARIAPLLIFTLLLLAVLVLIGPSIFRLPANVGLWRPIAAALTFSSNILYGQQTLGYPWDTLWSLSVEEAFYLGFPLLCLLGQHRVFPVLITLVAVAPLYRALFFRLHDYVACFDTIAIGCITAFLATKQHHLDSLQRRAIAIAGTLIVGVLYVVDRTNIAVVFVPTLMAVGTAMVLFGSIDLAGEPLPITAPLRWIGRGSYELYMLHSIIILLICLYGVPRLGVGMAFFLYLATSVVICCALGALVFDPLNKFLRRKLAEGALLRSWQFIGEQFAPSSRGEAESFQEAVDTPVVQRVD